MCNSKGLVDSVDSIWERLRPVMAYALEVEVITSALLAMKEDPTISPEEAFRRGCEEWDV